MADVCLHSLDIGDIIQRQLSHTLVHLQQQGQRLTNATSCTKDGDLSASSEV